jgi:hypothetical protein
MSGPLIPMWIIGAPVIGLLILSALAPMIPTTIEVGRPRIDVSPG